MICVVEATGKATCKICEKKIAKGTLCFQYFYGSWNTKGYEHIQCVFMDVSPEKKVKLMFQELNESNEVKDGNES